MKLYIRAKGDTTSLRKALLRIVAEGPYISDCGICMQLEQYEQQPAGTRSMYHRLCDIFGSSHPFGVSAPDVIQQSWESKDNWRYQWCELLLIAVLKDGVAVYVPAALAARITPEVLAWGKHTNKSWLEFTK